jgi:hypothetical protein
MQIIIAELASELDFSQTCSHEEEFLEKILDLQEIMSYKTNYSRV